MERKISFGENKYEAQQTEDGMEFWQGGVPTNSSMPHVVLRHSKVVRSMYYRIVELEDQVKAKDERLALADQQYAGVVLALGEAAAAIKVLQERGPVVDHQNALQDALWTFKKETGALAGGPEMKAVESAIAVYLQHGVAG